ncbi:MAG: VOC family protein [Acidimicrobiia bacterium]|nr:VOC family protein [Acidimicrobiia bacterium]
MTVKGISHVAIGVSDMDQSLAFYGNAIGLEVMRDTEEDVFGERRRAVYLGLGGSGPHEPFVVLDQQLTSGPFGSPPRILQLGTHHFSFWVDDVPAVYQAMVDAGGRTVVGPEVVDSAAYGEAPGRQVMTAIVKDPDGNPVQIDQRLDDTA